MEQSKDDLSIWRTPNPYCPACQNKRRHVEWEWKRFHPQAGTGFSVGQGDPEVKRPVEITSAKKADANSNGIQ